MAYSNLEQGRSARRDHYNANKDRYSQARKRMRARRREWLDLQKSKPCLKCGNIFPPIAMDFHHRNKEEKLFEINAASLLRSMQQLQNEIAKCDLLCAVCHRLVENQWSVV